MSSVWGGVGGASRELDGTEEAPVEISIVLPCLNEEQAIGGCVDTIQQIIAAQHLSAEILVVDNASTDRSAEIARAHGARVVSQPVRGYGNAYLKGFAEARGTYIVMADADSTYDFHEIAAFVEPLRQGYDLVMGNRFAGGIEDGAMVWSHRYVGNPALSSISRLFFRTPVADMHCGMRGFRKDAFQRLRLRATGMEFASEMVIKASLQGMRIAEVPVTLSPDGRSRPPHLRTWRDGWRHLRFMLLFSPRWLFFYPGVALFAAGLIAGSVLEVGPVKAGPFGFDIHTLLLAGFACLIGYQLIVFAVFTKVFAMRIGFHPPNPTYSAMFRYVQLETGLVIGALMFLAGVAGTVAAVLSWRAVGFGALDPRLTMREIIPAAVVLTLGVQTIFASFFLSILGIDSETGQA